MTTRHARGPVQPGKAVLLLRVSTKRQLETAVDIDPDGLSIFTQREWGQRKAESINAEIIEEFIEPGQSAKTIDKRPVFRKLLRYLAEHPEVKYVIVYMRSRAFRNRFDAAIIETQLKAMGVRLISTKEDFGEGPHAEAMEGMLDVMNDLMNKLQGLDIQEKMRTKAVNGGTLGFAKVGYLNVRVEFEGKQINTVALDENRAPLVRKAFELYATGDYSLDRLEATMADLGLTARQRGKIPERPVSFQLWHKLLQNPYYAGWIEVDGELYPGRHEPIVTQELFDRVQDVMNFRSRPGQRDRVLQHYLKGGLFCDRCQSVGRTARLIYTEARGRSGNRYEYFLCRGRQDGECDLPYLPAEVVEQAIVDHYASLQLPADFVTEAQTLLDGILADETASTREVHAGLKRRLKELDAQEERLVDLAVDDAMPKTKIKERLRRIRTDRAGIEEQLSATTAELAVGAEVLKQALTLITNPRSLYETSVDDVRRHLNEAFYEKMYLDVDGVRSDELRQPFADLHEVANARQICHQGTRQAQGHRSGRNVKSGPTLPSALKVTGSSKTALVELRGLEPLTPTKRFMRLIGPARHRRSAPTPTIAPTTATEVAAPARLRY
ncbi:recombinase family protein [Nocardia sp. CA-119907]|uniref:recombinase family protein n=1 Tax=Nocardia sp. CA-119907 TaxID=3239973 RepID=UPI003D989D51